MGLDVDYAFEQLAENIVAKVHAEGGSAAVLSAA